MARSKTQRGLGRGGRLACALAGASAMAAAGCADLVGARFDKIYEGGADAGGGAGGGAGGEGGCGAPTALTLQDALSRPLSVQDVDFRACDDVALVGHGLLAPGPDEPPSPIFVQAGAPGAKAPRFECGVNLASLPAGPVAAAGTGAALVRLGDEVYFGGSFRGVLRCPGAEKELDAGERSTAYLAKVDFSKSEPSLVWISSLESSADQPGFGHAFQRAAAAGRAGPIYAAGHASGALVFDPPGEGSIASALPPPLLGALVVAMDLDGSPEGIALLGEPDLVSSIAALEVASGQAKLALAGVYLGDLGKAAGPEGPRHAPGPGEPGAGIYGFVASLSTSKLAPPSASGPAPARADWIFGLGPAVPFSDPPADRPALGVQAAFADVAALSDGHVVAVGSYRGRISDAEGRVERCGGADPALFGRNDEGKRLRGVALFLDGEGHCTWLASIVSTLSEARSVEVLGVAEASSGLVYASVLGSGPLDVAISGASRRPLLEDPDFPLYTFVVEIDRASRTLRPASPPFAIEGAWQTPADFAVSPPLFRLSAGRAIAFAFATSATPEGAKLSSASPFLHLLDP